MRERPTDDLRRDHELVSLVVEAMEYAAVAVGRTGAVQPEWVARMVEFAQGFTDGCHQRKEEGALFPALLVRSRAASRPVDRMVHQHAEAREALLAVAAALPRASSEAAAREAVADGLQTYARLLREHMAEENCVLFSLAEFVLSEHEQRILAGELVRIENETIGSAGRERYVTLAHELVRVPLAA